MSYFCQIIKLSAIICPTQGDRRKAVRESIIEGEVCSLGNQVSLNVRSCLLWPVFPMRSLGERQAGAGNSGSQKDTSLLVETWLRTLFWWVRGGAETDQKSFSLRTGVELALCRFRAQGLSLGYVGHLKGRTRRWEEGDEESELFTPNGWKRETIPTLTF